MNSGSDFSGVKVGDRLWYMNKGVCVEHTDYTADFSIRAIHARNEQSFFFTRFGQTIIGGPQVLFYDKVEIIPPPRPKVRPVILDRSEIEVLYRRQNPGPESVTLPGIMMARIVETLMVLTTPEEVPYPEPKRLVKKTIEVRPYRTHQTPSGIALLVNPQYNPNDTRSTYCGPIQSIEIEVEE